eukprot:9126713-Alexandrium_andersonii.AAC.1
MSASLVGSEMCIRDRCASVSAAFASLRPFWKDASVPHGRKLRVMACVCDQAPLCPRGRCPR